jgi:hypothetical protein
LAAAFAASAVAFGLAASVCPTAAELTVRSNDRAMLRAAIELRALVELACSMDIVVLSNGRT